MKTKKASMRITKTKNSLKALTTLAILTGGIVGSVPHILAASSWAPTLLVNTESFQVIDDTDSASDLYLQFGGTLNKRLTYDRALTTFIFDDDLEVVGTISGATIHAQDLLTSSGQLIVEANDTYEPASIFLDQNANGTGMLIDSESTSQAALALDIGATGRDASGDVTNSHLLFGYNNVFDTNLFRQKADTLYTDDSLWVGETASGARIHAQDRLSTSGSLVVENSMFGAGLTDCDDGTNSKLLWDSTTGQFACGTDQAGGGGGGSFSGTGSLQNFFDNRYVNTSGDTMTGALVINTESDSTSGFQVNDADGGNPILNVDTTNERVGIGTASPAYALDVAGGDTVAFFDGSNAGYIGVGRSTSNYLRLGVSSANLATIGSTSTSPIGFSINGTELVRLSANGTFGIGTTNPTEKLEVVGTISGTTLHFGDLLSGSGYAVFRNITDSTTSFQINDADGGNPVFNVDTKNERVGIGTASPGGPLHVVGSSTLATFFDSTGSTNAVTMYLRQNGQHNDRAVITKQDDDHSSYPDALYIANAVSGTIEGELINENDGDWRIRSNQADIMMLKTGGNVGIGTQSPLARLDVVSTEYQTGAYIYSSGASVLALDNYSGTTGSGMNAHISFGYRNVFDTELYRHGGTGSGGIVIKTQQTSTTDNAFRVITQNGSENNTVFKVRADGAVTAEGSFTGGGADLAEWFPTADPGMKPGDITCLDPARPKHVKRCNSYDLKMIGIVSTKPGFVGNSQIGIEGNSALIGLIGQVPVKVIGNVDIGDSITLSKTDSVGKRAGEYDPSICIAMEEHRGGEIGVVTCLLTRNTGSSGGAPVNSKTVADYLLKSFKDTMRLGEF